MVNAGALSFREWAMQEPLPLATVQAAMLEFLRGRDDVVVYDAHAVNAYAGEPRMTQDIDLLTMSATALAGELGGFLRQRFQIAVRVRQVSEGRGLRLYQVRKSGNRHLADIRSVTALPPTERIDGVLVIAPADLIATKVAAYRQRRGQPKSGTDWRDLAMLLLTFPELKRDPTPVSERLLAAGADAETLAAWRDLAAQEIKAPAEDDDF